MEKPPHREEYKNLLAKQEGERANLRNEAHEEALGMEQEIGEHEEKIKELKGAPEAQAEKPASQEKLKYKSIELPEMVGKPLSEVSEYLKKTYGEERLAKIPDDLNTLSDEMKDAGYYHFFGAPHINGGKKTNVPVVDWGGGVWRWSARWLDVDWDAGDRVFLLED